MKTICLTFNAVAIVVAANVVLYMDKNAMTTWICCVLAGFCAVFPIDQVRKLYLLILDKRPRPRVWPTVVLADPQDGYPEQAEWRLIGTVTERR
jgi:hypothetical protein